MALTRKKVTTLFIDFDGTMYNTIQAVKDMYDKRYGQHRNYEEVPVDMLRTWDFQELYLADTQDIDDFFIKPEFFHKKYMMEGFDDAIKVLSKRFHICVVSMGRFTNLGLKRKFLSKYYPDFEFVGIDSKKYDDKATVDMSTERAIFIDDMTKNLRNCNAYVKVCFGQRYPWNTEYSGYRVKKWADMPEFLKRWY